MKLQILILCLIIVLAEGATLSPNVESKAEDDQEFDDAEAAGSNIILNTITALKPSAELFNSRQQASTLDLGTFPYESSQNAYNTFPVPQPSFGVAINSQAILGPKVEFLYLLESTINLISDTLHHVQMTFNDNYELIRATVNFAISKSAYFKSVLLKGISLLRNALEFALNIFNGLSITLPSITFGANQADFNQPHIAYGPPNNK